MVFLYVGRGYQNFCSLPGYLAQTQPILPQNMLSWAHTVFAGLFGALLVGGCGARAVSRKTPIYFILVFVVIVVIVVAVVVHENKIIMMLPDHLLCYIP